ncbi:MAG: DMT family transporter [Burkholderiales bacterium]|nr:DMT family transporter [Burkholderiales bacterium]
MSASWLVAGATFLFATMGVCVKLASAEYPPGEIVFYRSLTGAVLMLAFARWQGGSVATRVPGAHFWRSLAGVISLCLWFYAIGNLPLATAMTLNYMSSVWMALFLLGGAIALGTSRVDGRLVATVLVGFAGVALILRPTIDEQQLWHGLMGLLSGVIAATAYLQVTALGRMGEPEYRIVFWFSVGGVGAGGLSLLWTGMHFHSWRGAGLLLAVGLLATAAQMMLTRAYATGPTLVNASLQYLGIAWSFAYGVLLFDDKVTAMAIAGMLLIAAAGLSATLLRSRNARLAEIADPPNTV